MTEEQEEEIGRLVDHCDNLLGAAVLPLPATTHVEGLTAGIRELRERLAALIPESA